MSLRIVLADDHSLFRAGIATLLTRIPNVEVVGEASDGPGAISTALEQQPDLLIVDLNMPRRNGIDVMTTLRPQLPDTRFLVISAHQEERYVLRALRAGASGYVLKSAGPDELSVAVRAVLEGHSYLSPKVSRQVLDTYLDRSKGADTLFDRLTDRQREVLQLVGEGSTSKEIGEILHVSVKTVESHRKQLMDILGVRDLAGLVRAAVRLGLVEA